MKKYIAITLSTLLLSGCAWLDQEPNLPKLELPTLEAMDGQNQALLHEKWWENFGDTQLNSFVEYALQNNNNLQIALINVEKFREFLNLKKSEQLPRVDGVAGVSKTHTSKNNPPSNQGATFETYNIGLNASFEIDIFGKLNNAKKAAFEDLLRQDYLKEMIYQRVASDSVIAYYGLKSHEELYNIAKQQLLDEEEAFRDIENKYNNGFVSKNIYLQEISLLEMTKDNLLAQKEILDNYKTAIYLLVGKDVKEIFEASSNIIEDTKYDTFSLPVPANLPSDLLNKRADIKAAESKVKASAFNVSVARSAYFPSFSLTGNLGYVSGDLDKLVRSDSSSYGIGGNLLSPILDFGRIKASVENAKKDQQIALLEYEESIKKAFADIKNALTSYNINKERFASQEKRYEAINEKKEISKNQYENGYISYLEYLEVRKEEQQVASLKERTKLEALRAAVNLYYNLGGGFDAVNHIIEE